MRKLFLLMVLLVAISPVTFAQTITFGLGDPTLEASLNDVGASAKVDLPGFTAEVSVQWGVPQAKVTEVISTGLQPAEVYLAAALAKLSGKSIDIVVVTYKKNKGKGWGAVAKELGIKPGSPEFKALKTKSTASADKMKKKKTKP